MSGICRSRGVAPARTVTSLTHASPPMCVRLIRGAARVLLASAALVLSTTSASAQVSPDVVGEWAVTSQHPPGAGTLVTPELDAFVRSHPLAVQASGRFTWGSLAGELREIPAGTRSAAHRHYAGISIAGQAYVVTAVPDMAGIVISIDKPTTQLTLFEGRRVPPTGTERPNALGVEWAGSTPTPQGNPAPAPTPAAPSGGLGVEWQTSTPAAPSPPAPVPVRPTTSPAPAGSGGLGVEWQTSGGASAPAPATPTSPTTPPAPSSGGGLGVEWRTSAPPAGKPERPGAPTGPTVPPTTMPPAPTPPVSPPTPPAPHLVGISLIPESTTVYVGQSVRFQGAVGRYSDGSRRPVPVTYFAASGGTLEADGRFTAGIIPGQYVASAYLKGQEGGGTINARITVLANPVTALVATPASITTRPGQAHDVSVQARRADGSLEPAPVIVQASSGEVRRTSEHTFTYTAGYTAGRYALTLGYAGGMSLEIPVTIVAASAPTPTLPPRPNGICRDPWVTELVTKHAGRAPNGTADSGECDYRRYGGGRWDSKRELDYHVRVALGQPRHALYVIDGTASDSAHRNAMYQTYRQFDGLAYYWEGVRDVPFAGDAQHIYLKARDFICAEVQKLRVERVYLMGYSRGAIQALRLANELPGRCGVHVQFLGLVDAVNTSMGGWSTTLTTPVPHTIHWRKYADWEHVLTTAIISRVPELKAPSGSDHHQMVCDEGDARRTGWRDTRDTLVAYATRAGARFTPPTEHRTKC